MEKKSIWIDIHNDDLLVKLGIRQPVAEPRNPSVWTKTKSEKKALSKVRRKQHMFGGVAPFKVIPVQDKLIIYLKKNKVFPNTVYSTICYQHQIPNVLKMYGTLVVKYYFNGKTYKPEELPYWY